MKSSGPIPELGQIVAVRQRLYLVEESISPVNPGDSTLVRLSCVDDDAQGQTLDVLWEIEPDARAHEAFFPRAAFVIARGTGMPQPSIWVFELATFTAFLDAQMMSAVLQHLDLDIAWELWSPLASLIDGCCSSNHADPYG